MKKIIFILFIVVIPFTSMAQFVVVDNVNAWLNQSQVVNSLKELQHFVQQIRTLKHQLRTTVKSYKLQLKNLKNFKHVDITQLSDINQKIHSVQNAAGRLSYMQHYVKNKYKNLYDSNQRLQQIYADPEKAANYKAIRSEYLRKQAGKLIASATQQEKNVMKSYFRLDDLNRDLNADNLTAQQLQDLQAQISALNAHQLIEMKRILSNLSSFIGKKSRMSQEAKIDKQAQLKAFNKAFDKAVQEFKRRARQSDHIGFVPEWVKDNRGN